MFSLLCPEGGTLTLSFASWVLSPGHSPGLLQTQLLRTLPHVSFCHYQCLKTKREPVPTPRPFYGVNSEPVTGRHMSEGKRRRHPRMSESPPSPSKNKYINHQPQM